MGKYHLSYDRYSPLRKGGIKMPAAVAKKQVFNIEDKIAYIQSRAPIIMANQDKIELDKNNPKHIEWYEIDKYKGN